MSEKHAHNNLRIMKWFYSFRNFLLPIAIIVPFFQGAGLSLSQIAVLQSAFSATVVALEVPGGYLADRIGHIKLIRLGVIFSVAGFTGYALASSFIGFLIAEVLIGVSLACLSGSDRALIKSSMSVLEDDNEGEYFAKIESNKMFGEVTASIIGSLMAGVLLILPFIGQIVVEVILVSLAFQLKDLNVSEAHESENRSVKQDLQLLLKNRPLIRAIMLVSFFGVSTHALIWFMQPYYELVGIDIAFFGVIWSALLVVSAVFARMLPWIEHRFSRSSVATTAAMLLALSYLLIGLMPSAWLIALFAVASFMRPFTIVSLRQELDAHAPKELIATTHSVAGLSHRAIYIPILLALGGVADSSGVAAVYAVSAAVFAVALLASLIWYRKDWNT